MAPRVEDSDDELPELEDLVKSFRAGNGARQAKSTKTDLNVDSEPITRKSRAPRRNLGITETVKEEGEKEQIIERDVKEKVKKEVKKKRVLNQRADNPLLRPLNARSISSGSGEIKTRPKLGRVKEIDDEREDVEDEKKVLRMAKSRSITPAEEAVSEEKPVAKSRLKSSRQGSRAREDSEDSKVVSKPKSRSVTPLEDLVSNKEGEKPAATTKTAPEEKRATKSRARRVIESKQTRGRVVVLDLETEEHHDSLEENPARKSKPKQADESRKQRRAEPEPDSDDVEDENYGSDGISDFIVNDSTFLEEEDSVLEMPPPPPRSTRKLVQGRRRKKEEDSNDDDLDLELKNLSIKDDVPPQESREASEEGDLKAFAEEFSDEGVPAKSVPRKLFGDVRLEPPRKVNDSPPKKDGYVSSSDIEDPFTLRYSPSENKPRKVSKETRFATPPGSPEPKSIGLKSPKKTFQRIPSTPHRQSMDTFWQQDIINDWNDEYSPKKTPGIKSKSSLLSSPKKSPVKQDRAAKEAKKAFSQRKHEIASSFLAKLDEKITNNQISGLSASTGGVKIIWSKKLNTTAGRANWKRETIRSSAKLPDGTSAPPTHRHHAAIELAEKVIDDEDRLLNVIAHEFCHLANFMVSNIKTNPHGKEFKAWAAKCSKEFGSRGIEVTTKHSYEIDYKYIWECENCGIEFKRHSKSIDPKRHQCGSCKSKLVQTKPAPRVGTGEGGEKKVNEYAVFMKENMKVIKEENPGSPQKEIMGLVGKKYKEFKASKLGESKSVETVVIDEVVGAEEKEETPDDGVGDVVRKLDFLDLTSP